MSDDGAGSVTGWIEGMRDGESVAYSELWRRYFAKLAGIAESKLGVLKAEADGEDVALGAMASVMVGIREGRFPDLNDRASLWPLLVRITANKANSTIRRQLAAKRSAAATQQLIELPVIVNAEPSQEFAAELADQIDSLVDRLDDPTLRTIATQKLAGYTHAEIANALGVSVRTVVRKLKRVQQEWLAEPEGPSDEGRHAD